MWQHWVNFILGLWIVLSGYVGLSVAGMVTNVTLVGAVIAILGIWGALAEQSYHQTHSHA